MSTWRRRDGLTLIELLVVTAIMGVLLALILPAVLRVREAGNRVQCKNNLRQLGVALTSYHDHYKVLPPGCSDLGGKDPYPSMSWCTRLLPFLERDDLWRAAQNSFAAGSVFFNPPHPVAGIPLPFLACPSDTRTKTPAVFGNFSAGLTSYLGVEGLNQGSRNGLLYLDSQVRFADILDGTSNTIMVGERPPSFNLVLGWWYAGWGQDKDGSAEMVLSARELNVNRVYATSCPAGPYSFSPGRVEDPCSAFHFWSLHPGGAHFLFADGSVHFLTYDADAVLPALASRANGETVIVP